MKVWQCTVCKYIHKGDAPPDKCPVCGVDSSKFIDITETVAETESKTPAAEKPTAAPVKKPEESRLPQTRKDKIQSLLLKHHAHPISVHTPNGLLPVAVVLLLLAWVSSSMMLEKAAVINLVFVVLALPVVVYTGVLEWQKKYNGALTSLFQIKLLTAGVTCVSCVMSLVWYLIDPQVLSSPRSWVFILLNLIMLGAAGIAGHIGGKLVFKD